MTILVTGAAGFVGSHVAARLLDRGEAVIGLDSFNSYYDPALKRARAARLEGRPGFRMVEGDVAEPDTVAALVREAGVRRAVHLAAQAGVRHSIDNPFAYGRANLDGHLRVLEACRRAPGFEHLVYASSSSVYGDRPADGEAFREDDPATEPVSLYAATKRSGELMSTAYARLYRLPQTGLRFFTVYGPWGRPDMAYFGFTEAISEGRPIRVFGEGRMARDLTWIDDIVEGVVRALDRPPAPAENRILNIGGGRPVGLMDMIAELERALGREAVKVFEPMQPGDVTGTAADVSRLQALTGWSPVTPISEGLPRFVQWWREFYSR